MSEIRPFASVHPRSFQYRDPLGRQRPRRFTSRQTKGRFERDRIARYLEEIGGKPTRAQADLIAVLVSSEWDWLRHEAASYGATGREAADKNRMASESRRQFLLASREFGRIKPKETPSAKEKPDPVSLAQHLELIRRSPG
jgi:hypothetical protein